MKKIIVLSALAVTLSAACKSKTSEEKKAMDRVEEDKRKSDSVLEYYKRKADSVPDSI